MKTNFGVLNTPGSLLNQPANASVIFVVSDTMYLYDSPVMAAGYTLSTLTDALDFTTAHAWTDN